MYQFFLKISKYMAYLGGAVLTALIMLTCVSIIGRTINALMHSNLMSNLPSISDAILATGVGPVNGDFELVEAGIAFAIFAFLPLCQITGAHAVVDIFTNALSPKTNRRLQFLIDFLFAAVIVLITVQQFSGMLSKMNSAQVSLLLQFPVWWAYATSTFAAVIAAVVAVYVAIVRLAEAAQNTDILPQGEGAEH